MRKKSNKKFSFFEKMSVVVTKASGSTGAFLISFLVIIVWLVTGPVFNFSTGWQLVINTGTTIVTFLMVFLIQRSQAKDSVAIHLKLNELLVAHEFASNRLVAIESISEDELKLYQEFYQHLSILTKNELSLEESHSIVEAHAIHERKKYMNSNRKMEKKK